MATKKPVDTTPPSKPQPIPTKKGKPAKKNTKAKRPIKKTRSSGPSSLGATY